MSNTIRRLVFVLTLLSVGLWSFYPRPLWGGAGSDSRSKVTIIGKWRVTSDNPASERNRVYHFLANGTCIETYQSEQAIGSIDSPADWAWLNVVATYKYKFLGQNRYRMAQTKLLYQGHPSPGWKPDSGVIRVTIKQNKAVVYIEETEKHKEIRKVVEDAGMDGTWKDRRETWEKLAGKV